MSLRAVMTFALTCAALGAGCVAGAAAASPASPGPVIAQNVCGAPRPGRASCDAQVLVTRTGRHLVHAKPRRNRSFRRTATRRRHGKGTLRADQVTPAPAPAPTTPGYLQQAYDLGALSQTAGGSDTVAIVDAYDDPSAESDLAVYRSNFGLSPCTTANGCFSKVDQDGGTDYPQADSGWDEEISIDLDTVSAICPNCHIILVEANSNNFTDLAAAQAEAAELGANQISDSWGGVASNAGAIPGTYNFPGITTVAATGDGGYAGAGESQYPAALPDVTAAGGTTLSPSATLRGFTETAWADAGSGCDMTAAQPAWQTGPCAGRAYADISADADPNTGLSVYDSGAGGWLQAGGTSLSTPFISAYYAISGVNDASPAWSYENAALLNDPAAGSNGSCDPSIAYICVSGIGYDGPTGAGSISGDVATGAPGIASPGSAGSYAQDVSADSATLTGGVYPNGQDTSYYWQYGTDTTYGQQTPTTDVGSGPALTAVTDTLTGLQPDVTYHYRLVAQNATGTAYGYDFTFTTSDSTPSAPPAPTVSSATASVTGASTATLSGVVNAQGGSATYQFSYGLDSSYGSDTPAATVSGSSDTPVSAQLTGLSAGTTYHFSLTITSSAGTTSYADQTFTTDDAPSEPAPMVSITSAPDATTTDTDALITYTESGDVSSTACTLDGVDISASCVDGSIALSSLALGTHTVLITATGPGGSGSADVTWAVTAASPPDASAR